MKKAMKTVALLIVAAMTALSLTSLSACSDKGGGQKQQAGEKASSPATAKANKKEPAAAKEPGKAEEKKEEEKKVYSYQLTRADGKIKRDPFTPIRIEDLTPLRSYDVSQMKVNGVIIHGVKTANVVTPNGEATKVRIGDKIGIHDGVVVNITLQGVKVRETYLDAKGRIQQIERFIENK